jgi:lysophospholipase L1-like esterase
LTKLCALLAIVTSLFTPTASDSQKSDHHPALADRCSVLQAQMESLPCGRPLIGDFAQLAQFHDENDKLKSVAKQERRVVFLGDSITANWWNLQNSRGPFGSLRINRGISGQVTGQMLLRFRQDVIELRPKVVVILGGTNDLGKIPLPTVTEIIEENLSSMVELAHANGIRVVLATIPPISDYERDKSGNQIVQSRYFAIEKINHVNNWIKQYSKEAGCVYLDYFSAVVDKNGFFSQGLSSDGIHPNSKGYALMEAQLEKALVEASH